MNRCNHIAITLSGLAVLGAVNTSFAADLDVPGTYATIQAAIDAAVDGDRVMIAPGTYFETIDFLGKQIIVRSVDRDPTTVTIDANGAADHVVEFSGTSTSDARLIGVTVTGSGLVDQSTAGGGIYIQSGDPFIRRCIVRDNSANVGAGIYCNEGSPEISQCLIYDNATSNGGGAGIYLRGPGNPHVANCVVTANTPGNGAAGGLFLLNTEVTVRNTIIGFNDGTEIADTGSTLDIEYSLIEGGFAGTGNINEFPLFANHAGRDFHLTAGSPCIDAGDSNGLDPTVQSDLDLNPRRLHDPNTPNTGVGVPTIDMGAYEFIPAVRYVDVNATGDNSGITWDDAFTDFVDAIDAVTADPDANEIWVAAGTYKPDKGTGDRDMSFDLMSNQIWRGGFAGVELFATEADPLANVTILGGAIGASGTADNSHHVVSAVAATDAVIEGFVVQKGNAGDSVGGGGGMYIANGASVQANQMWIRQNESTDGAAGVYIDSSTVVFDRARLNRNVSTGGVGALNAFNADVTLYSSVVAVNDGFAVSGILVNDSILNVMNGTIYGNAGNAGVATHGIQTNNSSTKIFNTILWNNQGNELFWLGNAPLVANCTIEGAWQDYLGDVSNNGTDPQFVDLDGPNDFLGDSDDDFTLSPESNCIDSGNNNAVSPSGLDYYGGARQLDDNGMPNTGVGTMDRGAVEFQGTSCAYDCDDSGDVAVGDLLFLLGAWGDTNGDPVCEYVGEPGGDGFIDVLELLGLLAAWGDCPN